MADVLHGDSGVNQLNVNANRTQAYGLSGNDTLTSNGKSEVLLVGGSGDDSLVMLGGSGTLSGGKGKDIFELTYSADKPISAVIEDLDTSDKIIVNFDGNTAPQLTSKISGDDVIWTDGDGLFNLTLKGVRDNDYFDGTVDDGAWEVLKLTNIEREKENLSPLTMAQGLTAGASIRAQEIKSKGKTGLLTDHTRLDNKTAYHTVLEGKYNFPGENLAGGPASPEEVVSEWMKSDSHKENILRERFQKLGVGYDYDDPDPSNQRYYWTQMFADSLKSSETVSTSKLLTANIEINTVSNFIPLTDEDDTLNNSKYGMTIDAKGGDDSITNTGLIASVSGGAGKDSISNSASFATINAGTGNDIISLASGTKEILIQYAAGDGNDTISGFNESDTISISKDIAFTPDIVGDDVILTVGDDSIKFLGAASIAYDFGKYIDGYWSGVIVISEGNYQHSFSNNMEGVSIKALSGDNTITNGIYGDYVSIECGNGNDSVFNNGDLVTVNSGGGNDTIENIAGNVVSINSGAGDDSVKNVGGNLAGINGAGVIINAGDGADTVENSGSYSTLLCGDGSDSVINRGASVAMSLGNGNDTIWINSGSNVSIDLGAGNDYIIDNRGANVSIDAGAGNDIIGNDGASSTIDGGADNDNIINDGNNVSINGGSDNDTIHSEGSQVTISGGRGNDRIELSTDDTNNLIEYNEGDGLDEVWGFNETDKLIIGGGSGTYFPETLNGHLFIHVGTGYFAFGNGASLSAADVVEGVMTEPTENPIIAPTTTYLYHDYFDGDTVNYSNTRDNVIIETPTESIFEIGEDDYFEFPFEGNYSIVNSGENVQINGNAGGGFVTNTGNNVKVDHLGLSEHSIVDNSGNNVLIIGGYSGDSIVSSGDNVYVLGWMGDDIIELSGDVQNNIIAYQQGNGHDTVRGFGETDTLLVYVISPYSLQTVGNDIVIDVNNGYGTVTLEDAATLASPNITINRLNGNRITMQINTNSVTFEGDGSIEGNNLTLGEGNDSYYNTQSGMSIQAFGGNDFIINEGANVTVDFGAGNDFIVNHADMVSIKGGAGNDTLVSIAESDVTIEGSDGNDHIENTSNNASIDSGADSDTILSACVSSTINCGVGNDSIHHTGASSIIEGGDGSDTIDSDYGNDMTISGGGGDDSISHIIGNRASILFGVAAKITRQLTWVRAMILSLIIAQVPQSIWAQVTISSTIAAITPQFFWATMTIP